MIGESKLVFCFFPYPSEMHSQSKIPEKDAFTYQDEIHKALEHQSPKG